MMGFGFLGLLGILVFWAALVLLAVWVVRAIFNSGKEYPRPPAGGSPTAMEILDQRYARGEITREQYGQMKNALA